MPDFSGNPFEVRTRRHDQNLGMPFEQTQRCRMKMEPPKAPGECLMLIRRQVLSPEEDNEIFQQRTMDISKLFLIQRRR